MKKKTVVSILVIIILIIGFGLGYVVSKLNDKDDKNIDRESLGNGSTMVENEDLYEEGSDKVPVEEVDELPEEDEIKEVESELSEEKSFELEIQKSNKKEELEFGTPWKDNSKKDKSIAIDGRGLEGIEEGEGTIYLEEKGEVKSVKIGKGGDNLAPKYVEWYDDENFAVYMVNKYGRVFTGGTLYMINTKDMKPVIVYKADNNEEILEANKISADIINVKTLVYDDDANSKHVEKNIKVK